MEILQKFKWLLTKNLPYHKILWVDNSLCVTGYYHGDLQMCQLVCAAEDPENKHKQILLIVIH